MLATWWPLAASWLLMGIEMPLVTAVMGRLPDETVQLAAYGGVFVAGSLVWGVIFDGFRPDRFDVIGAGLCILGVAVIMYAPRAA